MSNDSDPNRAKHPGIGQGIGQGVGQGIGVQIRLQGHLHRRWASWFDGLAITPEDDGSIVLSGWVADQSALHGLLQKVRDLGLPLISVTSAPSSAPVSPPPSGASS